jgi:SPASM domain peptide maturase of grasp-with-spasm system
MLIGVLRITNQYQSVAQKMNKPGNTATFILFACCLPVKGARRSVICDLQRNNFRFIPNDLFDILTKCRGRTVGDIKELYSNQCDEEIDEYLDFLVGEEFGFWSQEPESFPELDLSWETAERITNAIIDFDQQSLHNVAKILGELDDLGCKALQVRIFYSAGLPILRELLELSRFGRLRSIEVLVGYSDELRAENLAELGNLFPRLSSVVVHSAPETIRVSFPALTVDYRSQVIDSPQCCGSVHPGYFAVNLEMFSESRFFNSCLNHKISIDCEGNIKNCPSLPRSFGNSREVSLHSALAHDNFKDLWEINKDRIDVCKDCEFRYMCSDCRAYVTKGKDDKFSKPSKCTYDPYAGEWRGKVNVQSSSSFGAARAEKGG